MAIEKETVEGAKAKVLAVYPDAHWLLDGNGIYGGQRVNGQWTPLGYGNHDEAWLDSATRLKDTSGVHDRCHSCGYTKDDASFNMDHHLCKNSGNAPWETKTDKKAVDTRGEEVGKVDVDLTTRRQRQYAIGRWCEEAFTPAQAHSLPQRGLRLLEEATEAAQACGLTIDKARTVVDYVFGRPVGEIRQELGGVGVTVLALAEAAGLSADEAELAEIERVLAKPIEHFKKRNQEKNDAGLVAPPQTVQGQGEVGLPIDREVSESTSSWTIEGPRPLWHVLQKDYGLIRSKRGNGLEYYPAEDADLVFQSMLGKLLESLKEKAELKRECKALRMDVFDVHEVVSAQNFAEMQQRAEAAESRVSELTAQLEAKEGYKLFVWKSGCRYIAIAHAQSIAEARELIWEDDGVIDESVPIRSEMHKDVKENTPQIFRGAVAYSTLTDSAELEESDAYRETQRLKIKELTAQVEGLKAENERLHTQRDGLARMRGEQ